MATFAGIIGASSKWLLDKIVGGLAATGVNPSFLTFPGLAINVGAAMFATGRFLRGSQDKCIALVSGNRKVESKQRLR